MGIKVIIFDLGKIFLDYSFDTIFQSWAKTTGIPATHLKEQYRIDTEFFLYETGKITIEQYYHHLCDLLTMDISYYEFVEGWNSMLIGLYPGSTELLDKIPQRISKVLLSNTNEAHTILLRKRYKSFFDRFESVFFSNEIGLRKPNAESFQFVLDRYAVDPAEVLYFDDMDENIESAKRMKINGILVTHFDCIAEGLKEYKIIA